MKTYLLTFHSITIASLVVATTLISLLVIKIITRLKTVEQQIKVLQRCNK